MIFIINGKTANAEEPYAIINVTYPTGSVCTCSKNTNILKAEDNSGEYLFAIPEAGTWTITATKGSDTASKTVDITKEYQNETVELIFTEIYGISRAAGGTSPTWTRTDGSIGKTATASVGTVAGTSDFDTCYPWSEIKRETLSTGDVMVKIPKFWYRRYYENNIEYIKISNKAISNFILHPAFNHGGVECDYIYVGAYKTSSNNKSVSGTAPQVNQTRATMRTNARKKGKGWELLDISTLSALQMLILVEFADNNVQAKIGRGFCAGNSAACKTGTCDSVPNLTGAPAGTSGKVDVVWRGIEGFWSNVFEYIDGLNFNTYQYFVCNNPAQYADGTSSGYELISYTADYRWQAAWISYEGLDSGNNPHVFLPYQVNGGSSTTKYCDSVISAGAWNTALHGGSYNRGDHNGLFSLHIGMAGTNVTNQSFGGRLIYIPS